MACASDRRRLLLGSRQGCDWNVDHSGATAVSPEEFPALQNGTRVLVAGVIGEATHGGIGARTVFFSGGYEISAFDDEVQLRPRRRFVVCTTAQLDGPLEVLAEYGDRLWIKPPLGEPITMPASWVRDVNSEGQHRG